MLNANTHLRDSLKAARDTDISILELIGNSDEFSIFKPVEHLFQQFVNAAVQHRMKITRQISTAAIDAILHLHALQSEGETSDAVDKAFMKMAGRRYSAEFMYAELQNFCDKLPMSANKAHQDRIAELEAQLAAATSPQPS